MKFSVFIPLYNKEKEIRRTVESVLVQSCPDFELVIIDDGSTDGSAAIAEALCAEDPRIRLIRKANGGAALRGMQAPRPLRGNMSHFWMPIYLGPGFFTGSGKDDCRFSGMCNVGSRFF